MKFNVNVHNIVYRCAVMALLLYIREFTECYNMIVIIQFTDCYYNKFTECYMIIYNTVY